MVRRATQGRLADRLALTSARGAKAGFTLIELMVVAVVLAILAAVIIPNVVGRTEVARRARAESDIAALEDMLELFYLDVGRYPTAEEGLRVLYFKPDADAENWRRYARKPRFEDPWGNGYVYRCPGLYSDMAYEIVSHGKDKQAGGEDDNADVQSWVETEFD